MKRFFLSAPILLFSVFLFASFNTEPENLLIRKWHFADLQSPMLNRMISDTELKISALNDSIISAGNDSTKAEEFISLKENYESQKNMIDEMMEKMKLDGWLSFDANGQYYSSFSGTVDSGLYSVDEDCNWLITTDGKGKNDTLSIDELTDSSLILSVAKDSTRIIFSADPTEK